MKGRDGALEERGFVLKYWGILEHTKILNRNFVPTAHSEFHKVQDLVVEDNIVGKYKSSWSFTGFLNFYVV